MSGNKDVPELPLRGNLGRLPDDLLPWFRKNARDLPWRKDREPYHVWISEIMLQQTRVEAVRGYYARFMKAFPSIGDLASAPEDSVLKLWEGLGYYSRARNIIKAAKQICSECGGVFPEEYKLVRSLPGIGDYTAGAICSICFDEKTPAVDGNVLRVISRLCGYEGCIDDLSVRRYLRDCLAEIYPDSAGEFTQAMMELGAIVCVPNGMPRCEACPAADYCAAAQEHSFDRLPVRKEKKKRRVEHHAVFLLSCGERIAILKRPDQGLLAGLYEFPNAPGPLSEEDMLSWAEDHGLRPYYLEKIVNREHIFTHIEWKLQGVRIHCAEAPESFLWITPDELRSRYSLPSAFRQFLPDLEVNI